MNSEQLSSRLQSVSDFIIQYGPNPIRLADIGTDHAYLPSYLVQQDKIEFAIAGDVVKGPFESAVNEVKSQGLTDQISVRLGDGLEVIQAEDNINTISICGMGGTLIRNIIESGRNHLPDTHLLVLQPNIGEPGLREWLSDHQYKIIDETVIIDGRHDYEIIVAETTSDTIPITYEEKLFGPVNLVKRTNEFYLKWERDLAHRERIYNQIKQADQPNSDKLQELEQAMTAIKEVLERGTH